jgi:hypothetical protein
MDSMVAYLLQVGTLTASQVFILLGPGILLALIMYYISEILRNQSVSLFGYNFWVYFTSIGIMIHELGHAIFAVLFGHRIIDIKLFSPNPSTGTLGYVYHVYKRDNLYQVIGNFFIGIGPIILGSLVIFFSSKYLIGDHLFSPLSGLSITTSTISSLENALGFLQEVYANALQMVSSIFVLENFTDWKFYVFLYLIFAIGTHVKLSGPDLQSAWLGLVAFVGLVFVLNLFTLWIGDLATEYVILISKSYSFFYAIMLFTIVLSVLLILLFAVLMVAKRAISS